MPRMTTLEKPADALSDRQFRSFRLCHRTASLELSRANRSSVTSRQSVRFSFNLMLSEMILILFLVPMEFETTQKLSFMPVCPAPKEDMPWARKASYCRPSIQFAKDTVAKLSYQPPGCFIDDCSNDCCYEVQCNDAPRASC